MIKLFSKTYLNKAQGLRIFCRLLVAALIVAAALTTNAVFAQSSNVQDITVPSTVNNSNGSLTVSYAASFNPTPPTLASEDEAAKEIWLWSSNCTPQGGQGSTTASYTASAPGSFSSVVTCKVAWSVVNKITGELDSPYVVSASGSGTTICDFSASGFSVSVNATLTPTTIAIGESATGSASATITGTTSAAKAELSEFNPQPTYSVVVTGKPSDSLPVASINSSTGQNLVVAASASTTPDTYSVIVTATYAWTDTSTNVSYGASGSATLSETVVLPTYTLSARLTGSGGAYGSSCIVPANSGSNSSADLLITVTGPHQEPLVGIPAPSLVLTPVTEANGVNVGASASCTGTSDANGHIVGSFSASDLAGDIQVAVQNTTSPMTISQVWDQIPDSQAWQYSQYADLFVPDPVSFSPCIITTNGNDVAITGHKISMVVTEVDGIYIDDNGDEQTYSLDSDPNSANPADLSSYAYFSGTKETTSGVYSDSLTIIDVSVDDVDFEAFDNGTY